MKNAFTLVEVLIVIAIIGLLAAIAIPSFKKAKQEALKKERAKEIMAANEVPLEKGTVVEIPQIKKKSSMTITAMGECTEFTIYKVVDSSDGSYEKILYVVKPSESNVNLSVTMP